jgi:hypothetical protein
MSGPIDIFLVYSFLKRLTTPFDKTEAFKLGLIDSQGTRLKKAETPAEKASLGYFDRLVFNLKRLLAKIPGGSTQLATFAAALLLLREQDEKLTRDEDYLLEEFRHEFNSMNPTFINEMMTAGAIAGLPPDQPPGRPSWNNVNYRVGPRRRGRPRRHGQWFDVSRKITGLQFLREKKPLSESHRPRWIVRKDNSR